MAKKPVVFDLSKAVERLVKSLPEEDQIVLKEFFASVHDHITKTGHTSIKHIDVKYGATP